MTAHFLSKAQTAALFKVSVRTLERWAQAGIGPTPLKHGPRLVRYDNDEVLDYLRNGELRESAS
ncbi:helix-turn-helix transcriptional regulator [Streptomyces sp. DI166]|uniref:helix-turn-helix transcriptional regulator n=1 Tax=Streptomyces sp. DI166 TaxID=1839783 RepID=UPI000B821AE5|nr:helix-turn-helix domain-containing protein [Streptomyces sp. DI166]